MELEEFNKKYRYKSDIVNFNRVEHWTVIEPDSDGYFYGDCEDYVLTLIEDVVGYDDLDIYYCKIGGEGHCIGVRGDEIIDCNIRQFLPREQYEALFVVTDMRKLNSFSLFAKKLQSWYNLLILRFS